MAFPVVFDDFQAGLWIPASLKMPLPRTALLTAQNIEYFLDGSGKVKFRGRRGKLRLNTDMALPGAIRSIWRHYPPTGTPSTLVAYEDSGNVNFQHDTNNDGILQALVGSFNAQTGQKWHFVNFPQKAASYGVNGYNGLRKYEGTTLAEVTLSGGVFAATGSDIGPYIAVWRNRLWVTKRDELQISIYASDLDSDSAFPGANQLSLDEEEGGKIVGIVPWNDMLLFFKTTGVWRFIGSIEFIDQSQLTQYSTYGCIAPESIRATPWGIMYLGRDGLRITDGEDNIGVELSEPIKPLFLSPATQMLYSTAIGEYFSRKHQYLLKLDGTSDMYVLQRLEMQDGMRWLWSVNTNFATVTEITAADAESDNGILYMGDSAGKFWEADRGSIDDDNNNTTPIPLIAQTAFVRIDEALRYGRAIRAKLVYRGKSTVSIGIRYDDSMADSALFSMGWNWPSYKLESFDRAIHAPGNMGQWISAVINLPDASYESEFYELQLPLRIRGLRGRQESINTM